MIRFTITFFFIAWGALLCAQDVEKCGLPMSNGQFKSLKNKIGKSKDDDLLKSAKAALSKQCLTAEQVKQIAELFTTDADRLEFGMASYHRTLDQENFYAVYDAFTYFSMVFRLHDYILEQKEVFIKRMDPAMSEKRKPPSTFIVGGITYPNVEEYQGEKGCPKPMAEHDFRLLHDQISRGETDKQKYMVVSSALKENCFSATQVMNLVKEFDSEPNRFALLKYATPKVYDKGNYRYAEQMLKDEKLKGDFILFIDQKNVSKKQVERQIKLPSSGCKLADTEYKEIVASISRHSFVNIKLNITKSLIADKKCMSIEQIGGLINLFPQEHHKLTLAKYAVKHLEDQSKIDGLPKYMNSPASKAHLTEYINEVKKERKKG